MALQSYYQEVLVEAGCDEAGRGCLAGPVFAAAVILPKDFEHPQLNDSKLLSEKQRYQMRAVIEEAAIAFAVASLCNHTIDELNILHASFRCMHEALKKLRVVPELLLIDGNRFHAYENIPHHCIVDGDRLYASIAAAGILAKTYRDDFMQGLHRKHPEYGWTRNKGYGTKEHQEALTTFGPSPFHRRSFRLDYTTEKNCD